jgi:hypothetical protein
MRAAMLLACVGILTLASCKGGGQAITITILPGTTESVDEGQPFNFTVNLGGDTTNKGVKWTLSNSSTTTTTTCTGIPACGTLTNMTIYSVTYTAPTNLAAAATVTLTATSIANSNETATATISIELPPTFTTTTLPQCAVNVFCLPNGANGVPYNQTIMASGGIGTLIFTVPANSLPKGLTLNTTGVIVGTPSLPTVGQQAITTTFTVTVTDSPTLGTPSSVQQEFSITVTPPPLLTITTNSPLAAGFINGTYNAPMSATGGVTPYTWTLASGSQPLPPGLGLNPASGQITGVPTLQNGATYPATYSFAVQVQDVSLPTQTKTQSFSITIQKPGPLQITAGLLPQGTTATAYSTSLSATGGIAPYTWALVGGTLPAGLALSSNGTISGIPIVATNPPTTSFFQVQVTDSEATPVTAGPQSFGITVAGGANNNSLINGQYSFLFNGYDVNGALTIAGTVTMDGNGNITTGSEDINRAAPANTTPSPTIFQNATITGTYSLDNSGDGRGTMELIVSEPNTSPAVTLTTDYRIAIDSKGNIRFFEDNDLPMVDNDTFSTHGQGIMKPVPGSAATGFNGFQSTSFTGNYAFEFAGTDTSGKPAALAGEFHANGSSTISGGTGDFNDAGTFSSQSFPISGSISMPTAGVRGATQFVFEVPGKPQVEINFAYYFVSPSDIFFIELDQTETPQQTVFYRLSGEAIFQQTGVTFTNSSLTGGSVISGTGLNSSGNADVLAGLVTSATGNGNATLIYDENNGGTVTSVTAPITGTYSVGGSGRVAFGFPGWTGHPSTVAYLYGPGQGFFLGGDSAVTTGLIEQQSGGPVFSAADVQGSYAVSNAASFDSKSPNVIGQANSDGANNISGVVDEMDASLTAHLGQSLAGSLINSLSTTTGRGTVTFPPLAGFPTTGAFYVVSTGSVRFVSADSGAQHPELIFFNH